MKHRAKHVAEYVLLRSAVFSIRILPYRLAMLLGCLLAWIGFYILRFRVDVAKQRIKAVFGDKYSAREIHRIAWISWRNFVLCIVDMARLTAITEEWMEKYVANYREASEMLLKLKESGKGAILGCPHMGSWELAGVVMQKMDVPIFFITGRQKNPLVDAFLNRMRGSTGIETVQRGSGMLKGVIKRLRKAQVLAFLPDVRMNTEGLKVQFLGSEANVVGGMGLFSRQADVPIVTSIVTRVGIMKHNIAWHEEIWPDKELEKVDDWQRSTQQAFSFVEEAIRKQPEQWFWFNKRWILDPLEEDVD